MKLLNKIKNGLVGIGLSLLALPSKVLAADTKIMNTALYGTPEPTNTMGNQIWNICKFFVIPLALIIGFIIYFKKSKSSTKRKVVILVLVLVIVAILYFVINYLMKKM